MSFGLFKNKWCDFVGFLGISTLVGYSIPNPVNEYTLSKYNLLTHFGHIFNKLGVIFCTQLNGFK